MPGSAKRWKQLAEELAAEREQAPRPPGVRKGRMARAKRRAELEAGSVTEPLAASGEHPGARRGRRR